MRRLHDKSTARHFAPYIKRGGDAVCRRCGMYFPRSELYDLRIGGVKKVTYKYVDSDSVEHNTPTKEIPRSNGLCKDCYDSLTD